MIRSTLILAAGVLGLGGLAQAVGPLALVNATHSLPRGLYLRQVAAPVRRGSVVAVEPPPSARRYLSALGMPAAAPLLKRVVALPGDAACGRDGHLQWSGGEVRALPRDRLGTPLPAWRGCGRLPARRLLVLGDTPTSFDSRYFGPVDRGAVTGVYVAALTW